MNTNKSLDGILLKYSNAVQTATEKRLKNHGDYLEVWELATAEAKQAIVEAVEGLLPPEFEQPKRYLKEHTELQRAETKARIDGHNQCRAWMLQAIKEWQNYGE